MFDEYAKKLEDLEANVPKIFKAVAKRGANHFIKEAKEFTDREELVDTGNYRRNWTAEVVEPQKGTFGIVGINPVEYASDLEYGHKLRNGKRWKGRFVGKQALNGTEGWTIIELQYELDLAMAQKKYSITRAEAKKYF